MSDRMLNVNTATVEELKLIPGVGDKIAQLILHFKEIYGVVRKEALILALRGDISPDVLDQIDFSVPRMDDPFEIDIECLPAVPKTNSWEKPIVSFNKQMASRLSSPHESRSPESQDNLLEFYEKMSSPVEKTLALLKKFSDKDEMHSFRNSHTSPVDKKGDKRQLLGNRQIHTINDRTTCGSKSPGGHSASSRFKSKLSTARDSTSRCSSGSRSPDSHRSAIKQKTTKTRKSSESRSRSHSPSSKKVARQQKKIKTRNSSRSGGGKSRLNRSYSRSSSRSKLRSGHHLKRSYRKVAKKNRSSSRSGSRSSSVRHHSRKSKKSHKRSQSDSSSRSPSQSVGRGSTSRLAHHSKRKVVRKNRESSRSDSRSKSVTGHSRKYVLKHRKNRSHRRSRSTSRWSRSSSRSSSLLSRSHKGHTRSQKMNHTNRHKNRHHSSSSRSSSSSQSPSSSRSHRTKRSKSRKSKRSSSLSYQSPSKSRSHRTKGSKSRKLKRSSNSSHSRSRSHGRKKTRSHKLRRSKRHASSSSDSDISDHQHSYRHGNPRKHPKALRFDGKTNWLSFKKKFNSYRKVMKWSETESKDYMMWSLEGKALDFFTIISDIEKYSFRRIVKKLEARFGVKELTVTSKVKFQQASQRPDESLEDWADRVMTLSTPAFVDLSEDH